ncbi:MAG TPA: ribonuclease HII [Anaerovoracaceae bacterium]|nr:ribonuclease HII [Anaerovoracaceae bacterium]
MSRKEKLELKLKEMSITENELHKSGKKLIAGVDEVGRGPLAGPVYAACVVLPKDFDVLGVNDSKKLSEKKRIELDKLIREKALAYGIGIVDNDIIDEINILNATKLAMMHAIEDANDDLIENRDRGIEHILIDALVLDDVDIKQTGIVKGDSKSVSIAAASIVAKVARDDYMIEQSRIYPYYSFESNKGYGTKEHYEGLDEHGITPIHRKTFLKKYFKENGYGI